MTLEEKFANTDQNQPGAPRLGLPPYIWWNEALHGIAEQNGVQFEEEGEWSHATSFPQPILTGAAFDDDLVHQGLHLQYTSLQSPASVQLYP